MEYSYITVACPECGKMLFIKITKILGFVRVTSGLGPQTIICSSCNTRMITNFKEWKEMILKEKFWYFFLSITYGTILGWMTSIAVALIVESVLSGSFSVEMAGLYVVVPITLFILLIQFYRIHTSIRRSNSAAGSEKVVSFWNWETNLQFYGGVWLILSVLGTAPLLFI